MSDLVKAILEAWLPTTWSRLTAGATISSAIGAFFLPEFLRLLCIQISDRITLLIRIGMPLLVLLSGTFLVLLIVVQHSKILKSQKQPQLPMPPPVAKPTQLPKEQIDILLLLFEQGELLTFQIAQSLNMEDKEEIIKYHLQELVKGGLVRGIHLPGIGPPGQSSWFIYDKGKKYLIESKLIS